MKVFFVSDARLPTEKGHGLAIMKTCEALAEAGVDIELVVPDRHNALREDPFTYYGIQTPFPLKKIFTLDLIRFGRFGFLIQEITFALAAAWYLREKKAVVYSRDDVVLWVLWLCGYRRFVWESHTGRWNRSARVVARGAFGLVVISRGLKNFYTEKGIAAENITVVPSAIDMDDFDHPESTSVARARLGLPSNLKVAMYIGRLDGWKGSATLLEASKLLPKDIVVVVIGGEAEQIESLKLRYPQVVFLGFRPYSELPNNQAAADVLIVPNTGKDTISSHFTSPLKVVAHMASNRPIVASDLPSIRELTGDGALFVLPDDPRALAGGIQRVLSDRDLALQITERARENVRRFSWDTRADLIRSLLEKTIA